MGARFDNRLPEPGDRRAGDRCGRPGRDSRQGVSAPASAVLDEFVGSRPVVGTARSGRPGPPGVRAALNVRLFPVASGTRVVQGGRASPCGPAARRRRAPGTAVAGTRIGTESPPRTAARPAGGKPGRWTNPAAYARRSAPEADFSCLRSAYRGAGYLPRRGGCRSTPQRIRQLDQQVRRCPAGLGARPRGGALPCYKSWPRDEARVNVLTRETSIGKPNRRSARCRYEETTFRSPCVPGRSGPARGVPSSSRPVPGLPSVPCDSSAAASPNSRPRRSGGVNATTTYGMVQEAIMHKRFKNLRAARGRPEGSRPSARRCRRRAGAGRIPGRAGRRRVAVVRAYRPAVVQANVGVRPGDCRGICQDRRIGRRAIRRAASGSCRARYPESAP